VLPKSDVKVVRWRSEREKVSHARAGEGTRRAPAPGLCTEALDFREEIIRDTANGHDMSRHPNIQRGLRATPENVLDRAPRFVRQPRQYFVRRLLFIEARAIVVGDSEAAL
jgi:hypothetical protein